MYFKLRFPTIVYFNQQMGALHTDCWLKSSFSAFLHFFPPQTKQNNFLNEYLRNVLHILLTFFFILIRNDAKIPQKMISIRKLIAKHPLAGQNTQHLFLDSLKCLKAN